MKTVPFFVVDRPISLKIIEGLNIPDGQKIGLMAHANTSANFRHAFRNYPRRRTVKMCDSAIFHEDRFNNNYDALFTRYTEMGADFGIIIDVLGNASATIRSAKLALRAYNQEKHKFTLVGVAQGNTIEQYLECYRALTELGFDHIAVGGLLQKRERSARYMNVRDKSLMEDVLKRIRDEFDPNWLFVLGCLHPSRLKLFKTLGVSGDYKGWIFEYEKRDESLEEGLKLLSSNHLAHAPARLKRSDECIALKQNLEQRELHLSQRNKARRKMFREKRKLQDFVAELHDIAIGRNISNSAVIQALTSRGLLNESEQKSICAVLNEANLPDCLGKRLRELSKNSRNATKDVRRAEKRLAKTNSLLLLNLANIIDVGVVTSQIKVLVRKLSSVLKSSEQDHRIKQVRKFIQDQILDVL
jgi:hypothetical protein